MLSFLLRYNLARPIENSAELYDVRVAELHQLLCSCGWCSGWGLGVGSVFRACLVEKPLTKSGENGILVVF